MFQTALSASLPLIQADYSDTLHLREVVSHYAPDREVVYHTKAKAMTTIGCHEGAVVLDLNGEDHGIDFEELYRAAIESDVTWVLLNKEETVPLAFQCGAVETPAALLAEFVTSLGDCPNPTLEQALMGLTLRQASEVVRMARVVYGSLEPRSVSAIRRKITPPTQGLYPVDITMGYYQMPQAVKDWLGVSGKVFISDGVPYQLKPRGLLFDGQAGTGKTMASKVIAKTLGLPLYRLDVGSTMNKYIGQSEANLTTALRTVDAMQPCVLLLDEVEKLFTSSADDAGVSSRMLSNLLWWMQERDSLVLVIMTCNDTNPIPPELYRDGRIDRVITLAAMDQTEVPEFAAGLALSLGYKKNLNGFVKSLLEETQPGLLTPSHITGAMHQYLREQIVKGEFQ